MKVLSWLMISCRKAGELVEKKLHGEITVSERAALAMHSGLCEACRAYEKDSARLQKAISDRFNPMRKEASEGLKQTIKDKVQKHQLKK